MTEEQQQSDDAALAEIYERFDKAGFRLLVIPVQNVPETWHAVALPGDQPGGTVAAFAGSTKRGAAEAAFSYHTKAGMLG